MKRLSIFEKLQHFCKTKNKKKKTKKTKKIADLTGSMFQQNLQQVGTDLQTEPWFAILGDESAGEGVNTRIRILQMC